MGYRATDWAVEAETGKPTAKCILLVLAKYADDNGCCYPSQERIARQAEMSVDSLQRRLRDLEAAGFIERKRRHGPRGYRTSDLYILKMHTQPHGNAGASPDRRENAPEPQLCGLQTDEPSEEPSIRQPKRYGGRNRTYPGRQDPKTPSSQPRPRRRDRGAEEAELARRLGQDGWDILLDLPETEVEHLCIRLRRGMLDDQTIARLRAEWNHQA